MFDWMGAFVMVAIGAGVWRAAAARRWLSALERLPVTPANELVEGRRAKVIGVVETAQSTAAPLTQRPCVGWTVRAVQTGRIMRSGACRFTLRDDDGDAVLVHAERAAMVLAENDGVSAARVEGLVHRESIVCAGDVVTVVGMVRRELDPSRPSMYREPPTRLVLDGIPLYVVSGRR